MSNFTIEIKAPELAEAICTLASALAIGKGSQNPELNKHVKKTEKSGEPKNEKKRPNDDPGPESKDIAKTTDTEEIPSVVDLRAKAQEKGKTPEGKVAIKALLNDFDSKSISDVPEDKRAAFLAKLEELL